MNKERLDFLVTVAKNCGSVTLPCEEFIQLIGKTEQLSERPHEHWIDEGQADNGDFLIRCSACCRVLSEAKQIGYVRKYCPNCGAKMDEEIER